MPKAVLLASISNMCYGSIWSRKNSTTSSAVKYFLLPLALFAHPCLPWGCPLLLWRDRMGQACVCFLNDSGLSRSSSWVGPSDRSSPFKSEECNCILRDHKHSKTPGWELSHCFTFRKMTLFIFALSELCSTTDFNLKVSWRVLPDVTNSSSWSDICYMASNNREMAIISCTPHL